MRVRGCVVLAALTVGDAFLADIEASYDDICAFVRSWVAGHSADAGVAFGFGSAIHADSIVARALPVADALDPFAMALFGARYADIHVAVGLHRIGAIRVAGAGDAVRRRDVAEETLFGAVAVIVGRALHALERVAAEGAVRGAADGAAQLAGVDPGVDPAVARRVDGLVLDDAAGGKGEKPK
jgi:hypothetical protein